MHGRPTDQRVQEISHSFFSVDPAGMARHLSRDLSGFPPAADASSGPAPAHAQTLSALRVLVGRFDAGSHLSRVPIPDQDEMREMVVAAFTTKARDDLSKLAADIAAAQRDGATEATVNALYKRFRDLQASAAEHAQHLNTSLDDTTAALQLVNAQLASLLANAS